MSLISLCYFQAEISHLYQIFPEDVLGSGQFGIVYGGNKTLCRNFMRNPHRSVNKTLLSGKWDLFNSIATDDQRMKFSVHNFFFL